MLYKLYRCIFVSSPFVFYSIGLKPLLGRNILLCDPPPQIASPPPPPLHILNDRSLIIEKLLKKLKEMFIFESIPESETEVEKIERETDEIGNQVDVL